MSSEASPLAYRPLQAPPKDITSASSSLSFALDSSEILGSGGVGMVSSSGYAASKTLVRPMQRLRNDEISVVRHQVPAVYEALAQYDSLYLNAEARMEAKENELTRCIEVGQEVLMQLHAVRQRCNEISDERDAVLEEKESLERQLSQLRQTLKQVERSYEDHYRSASTESTQATLQLQQQLQEEHRTTVALHAQLEEYKQEQDRLDQEVSQLRSALVASDTQRAALQQQVAQLNSAVSNATLQNQDDVAELSACVAVIQALQSKVGLPDVLGKGNNRNSSSITISELRRALHEVANGVASRMEELNTVVESHTSLERSLEAFSQHHANANEESTSLRRELSQAQANIVTLTRELEQLKQERIEESSPRRVQLLQASVDDKNIALAEAQKKYDDAVADVSSKAMRISHLETQIESLQRDLQGHRSQVDFESRAIEASQRLRISEQTIEQQKQEITKLQKVAVEKSALEDQLERLLAAQADLQRALQAVKSESEGRAMELKSRDAYLEELNLTLCAVQADMVEKQVHCEALATKLNKAVEEQQRREQEVATLMSLGSVAEELKLSREENATLKDSLIVLQRESQELQNSLKKVALDEQNTSVSMISRIHLLESELQDKSKRLSELSATERTLRQAARESASNAQQLKDMLDDQKNRMAEFLSNHVPAVMFQELEKDFHSLRQELQKIRSEAVTLQETTQQEQRLRTVLKESSDKEHKKLEDILLLLQTWEERAKAMEDTLRQQKGIRSSASVRSGPSSRSIRVGGGGSSTTRPLFVDPLEQSPIPIEISTTIAPLTGLSTSSISVSNGSRKLTESFLECVSELRRLIESVQERLRSQTSLPPDAMLVVATPQSFSNAMVKLFDVSGEVFEDLAAHANKHIEQSNARLSQVQAELDSAKASSVEWKRKAEALKYETDGITTARAALEADLTACRAKIKAFSDERVGLVTEADKERSKRTELEKMVSEYERKLEDAQADVHFESKSLASRCEQLREQLVAERRDHQTAMSKLFEEVSHLKQDHVKSHHSAHDDYANELRRRRAAETERDELASRLKVLEASQEELQDRAQRYAQMLQTAREEVEEVTATLNEVESSLQQDLHIAEEENQRLKLETARVQARLNEALEDLDRAERNHARDAKQPKHEELVAVQTHKVSSLQQEIELLHHRLEESNHIIATLEQRSRLMEERNRQLEDTIRTEGGELDALRAANRALEDRVEAVEGEREPLRQQLHSLLGS